MFNPHEAVDMFNDFSAEILRSPKLGREKAMQAVHEVTDDPEKAELLVRICLAVAEAKGEKNLVDQIEIVILCSLLGVEPRYAGLYTESDDLTGDSA